MNIFNKYIYEDKEFLTTAADAILEIPRFALNGREVNCIQRKDFQEFTILHPSNDCLTTVFKIIAFFCTILLSPVIYLALELRDSDRVFKQIESAYFSKSKKDKFYHQHLGHDWRSSLVAFIFSKYLNYDPLDASILIHGDAHSKEFTFPRLLNLPVSNLLLNRFDSYKSHQDRELGEAVKKGVTAVENCKRWSIKMTPLLIGHLKGVWRIARAFFPQRYLSELLVKDFASEIQLLKNNENMVFPVYIATHDGFYHMMVSVFTKINENQTDAIEWAVFQSGYGSKHHPEITKPGSNKKYVRPFVRKLPLEKIDQKFLSQFVDHITFKRVDKDADAFYKFVQDNTVENRPAPWPSKSYHRSDSCVLRSYNFALKYVMGETAYKKWAYLMKLDDQISLSQERTDRKDQQKKIRDIASQEFTERQKKLAKLLKGPANVEKLLSPSQMEHFLEI